MSRLLLLVIDGGCCWYVMALWAIVSVIIIVGYCGGCWLLWSSLIIARVIVDIVITMIAVVAQCCYSECYDCGCLLPLLMSAVYWSQEP